MVTAAIMKSSEKAVMASTVVMGLADIKGSRGTMATSEMASTGGTSGTLGSTIIIQPPITAASHFSLAIAFTANSLRKSELP